MKKALLSATAALGLLWAVPPAQAQGTLTFDQDPFVFVRPTAGTAVFPLTGTLTLDPGFVAGGGTLDLATNSFNEQLDINFSDAFLDFVSIAPPGEDFTGTILTLTLTGITTPGDYFGTFNNPGTRPVLSLEFSNSETTVIQNTEYRVSVLAGGVSTPEPGVGVMVLLGIGAAAATFRRRS